MEYLATCVIEKWFYGELVLLVRPDKACALLAKTTTNDELQDFLTS